MKTFDFEAMSKNFFKFEHAFGRIIMAIKHPNTDYEIYKARFIAPCHKRMRTKCLLHTSKTIIIIYMYL